MSDAAHKFTPYTSRSIGGAPQWSKLSLEQREAVAVVSRVLPFRVNSYVLDELIDWDNVPDDPIYRLTFPHRDMLRPPEYEALRALVLLDKDEQRIEGLVHQIRARMNPHPAGQMTDNVPRFDGKLLSGMQHKYRETVLFFPAAGQTCHAYCTFCFRWPQFVGMDELKFDARNTVELVEYLKRHSEVSDVLITGGDPMVMSARALANYIEPLLVPELSHIRNIRIGTKSVAYWPQRFLADKDADAVLQLFENVVASGRSLDVMAHYTHPAELRTPVAQLAARRIVSTGAVLRMQAPLLRHVNDDPADWAELWATGVRLGAVPYYMFVERDTGPSDYFGLPLADAYEIFRTAYAQVSGLARTVRGPSMSAGPGKVLIDGTPTLRGEKVFALQFLQGRDPDWVRRPFYAKFDPEAVWLDQLVPAFGEKRFFFEEGAAERAGASSSHPRAAQLEDEPS
ncbi:UNVERIFIED_ORG: L-lysine 2,3-aminomutase [Pseudomonas psychrophila]